MFPTPPYVDGGSSTVLNWYTLSITDQISDLGKICAKSRIHNWRIRKTKKIYTATKRCKATLPQPMKTSIFHLNGS